MQLFNINHLQKVTEVKCFEYKLNSSMRTNVRFFSAHKYRTFCWNNKTSEDVFFFRLRKLRFEMNKVPANNTETYIFIPMIIGCLMPLCKYLCQGLTILLYL